jgi:hypothetical protein
MARKAKIKQALVEIKTGRTAGWPETTLRNRRVFVLLAMSWKEIAGRLPVCGGS